MAKGYVLKYANEVVCAAYKKDDLVIYLHQKGVRRLNHYFEIERVPRNQLDLLYGEYLLSDHDETKMVATPEDIDAWNRRMEQERCMYEEALTSLKFIRVSLGDKKKDRKILDDAIALIEKRKKRIQKEEEKLKQMEEVLHVSFETILQERELMNGYHYAITNEK